tara:strand:+ start:1041 stop:2609 length:1569 start_codon:yes stop_codon:yes gene_type:complete
MDNIIDKIKNLYNKTDYNDIHGLDIWTSIIFVLVFFLAISYYHILNNLQPIKNDWINQRCKPNIIPFASLINKPDNMSGLDYTNQNFTQCIQGIVKNITSYSFKPFYYLMNTMNIIFMGLNKIITSIRELFNKLRNSTAAFVKNIMGRALNISIPIVQIIITAKTIAHKAVGTFAAAIYTLLGGYFQIQSITLFFMKMINKILNILVGVIIGLWSISWFFPPAAIAAASTSAIMLLILIPTIILKVLFGNIMELSSATPPGVPSCFSGDTLLKLKNNKNKKMSDININDVLFDGSFITAKFKASSYKQEIYKLDNIIVTGNHNVFHNIKGWITAKEHPDSILINNFNDPFVYCINTNTKTIKINNTTFADWDDIDDDDINKLKKNCSLPSNFNIQDIHKYFDAGFHPNMKLELENKNIVEIKDIKVNDILNNGERVCAVVTIDKNNMSKLYDFNIDENNLLTCTKNINILKNGIKKTNTSNIKGIETICNSKYLYHLVTDKKCFEINNVYVEDYNTSIEKFL